jgi:hypothetical protein
MIALGGVLVAALLVPIAIRSPLSIQRSLSVLPLVEGDRIAKESAQCISNWRIQKWIDVLPEIPRCLILGKGGCLPGLRRPLPA